jgi:Holliday junction resolvasome RuvABC endonuclease subunit
LMMLFYRHGITLQEYTPMQLKKYVTWNAKAGKDLVMAVVKNLFWLSENIEWHDTADALGLAYLAQKTSWMSSHQ